jgi:hypothetical protein
MRQFRFCAFIDAGQRKFSKIEGLFRDFIRSHKATVAGGVKHLRFHAGLLGQNQIAPANANERILFSLEEERVRRGKRRKKRKIHSLQRERAG